MKPSPDGANAPPPRGHEREILVGLFVIVGIVAVLTVLFTLTSPALFRGRLIVSTVVADAGGIRSGDPVQMKGVNIGRVSRFRLRPAGVAIELELEKDLTVPRDSEVLITSRGLLGDKVAQVILGHSSEPLRNGDVLPGVAEEGAGVTAARIADETTRALERVQALLSERTVSNVESSSVELSKLLTSLSSAVAEERGELERTTRALRRSAESVERVAGSPESRARSSTSTLSRRASTSSRPSSRARWPRSGAPATRWRACSGAWSAERARWGASRRTTRST